MGRFDKYKKPQTAGRFDKYKKEELEKPVITQDEEPLGPPVVEASPPEPSVIASVFSEVMDFPEPKDYGKPKPGRWPKAPAQVVEAKRVPESPGSKKIIEYFQMRPGERPSAVALIDRQKKAREVFDAFGGSKKDLHSKIRWYAKDVGESSQWADNRFAEIVNFAEALPEGARVGDELDVSIPQFDPITGLATKTKLPVSPLSTLEGLTQFVASIGGGDLDVNESRKVASKAGQITGDVAEIALSLGSTMSLGKTLLKSSSAFTRRIGGLLYNPDTNPIPDVMYAATEEGDFSQNFLTAYAVNLAIGRLIGGKDALKALKELPEGDRAILRENLETALFEAKKKDAQKVLGITDGEIKAMESTLQKFDEATDVVQMARAKKTTELAEKMTGRKVVKEQPLVKEKPVVTEKPKAEVVEPTPKPKPEVEDFEPQSAVFDDKDMAEMQAKLRGEKVTLKDMAGIERKKEPALFPKKDTPTRPPKDVDELTDVNVKREVADAPTPEPDNKTDAAFQRQLEKIRGINKPTLSKIRNVFVKHMIDASGNLKRELRKVGENGQKVIDKMEQFLGASGKAKLRHEIAMEDILSGLKDTNEKDMLGFYLDARRTVFLDDQGKNVGKREGLSPDEMRQWLKDKKAEDPERFARIEKAAERFYKEMRTLLDDRLEAGLINKNLYDTLIDNVYTPRVWRQHLSEVEGKVSSSLGESTTGIKKLADGSDTELLTDVEQLLARSISTAERQIASNNAGREMLKLMRSGEAGDMLVELKPLRGKKGQIKGWTKPPRGYEAVTVMEDGAPVQFGMKSDFVDEFAPRDPQMSAGLAKGVRMAMGTNLLKFNATQASTDFPLANVFRDIGTILFANKEYSNFIPRATVELGADVKAVFRDAVTRSGRYNDYINQGGSMDYLMATADTWGDASRKKLAEPIQGVIDGLRLLGETSEAITRLALRERAIKNYMKQGLSRIDAEQKATLAARRYMDFGQGGRTAKTLDNFMPYFNAGIQGHRAWMRGAKNDPIGFTSKITQVGLASSGLVVYNIANNPDAWDAIPDRIKSSNWVITTPWYEIDEQGNKRWKYFTIPKPPGISAAFNVFEAGASAGMGKDVPYKQIAQSMDDFMGLGSVPPTLGAVLALWGNVDSYTWEQIYKGQQNIELTEEITKNTPEWAIRAGEITGQSPERLRTAKSKYFTYRNGWWDMSAATVDAGLSALTDKDLSEATKKVTKPEGMPIIRRFFRTTGSEVVRERISDTAREFHTKKKRQKRELDKLVEAGDKKKVDEYIDSQPIEFRKGLHQRYWNAVRNKDIPKKYLDINYILAQSPEDKAKVVYDEWRRADVGEREKIDEYVRRIKGMASPRFMRMYNFYKKEGESN